MLVVPSGDISVTLWGISDGCPSDDSERLSELSCQSGRSVLAFRPQLLVDGQEFAISIAPDRSGSCGRRPVLSFIGIEFPQIWLLPHDLGVGA
jgi:hypothetical protein